MQLYLSVQKEGNDPLMLIVYPIPCSYSARIPALIPEHLENCRRKYPGAAGWCWLKEVNFSNNSCSLILMRLTITNLSTRELCKRVSLRFILMDLNKILGLKASWTGNCDGFNVLCYLGSGSLDLGLYRHRSYMSKFRGPNVRGLPYIERLSCCFHYQFSPLSETRTRAFI